MGHDGVGRLKEPYWCGPAYASDITCCDGSAFRFSSWWQFDCGPFRFKPTASSPILVLPPLWLWRPVSLWPSFWQGEHHEGEGTLSSDEERFFKAVGLAANVLLLSALSMEIWEAFGRLETTTIEPRLSQQLALSLLWILYSSVHIVLGVQRGSAALRRQGLALIGVVVLKAFLIDISFLERGYRILSFLVLGLVLMFVSFLYQKHFGRHAEQ